MTERTALFLVTLSHGGFWMTWPLPILLGAAIIATGNLQARARVKADAHALHVITTVRRGAQALFVVSCFVFLVAMCHVGCSVVMAHRSQCMSHSKQLAVGVLMYAEDYDEHLPATARWEETIAPRVRADARSDASANGDPFQCPAASSPASYGMNALLERLRQSDIDASADTVMLFDADAPRHSFAGGPNDLARERHLGVPNIVFADGHVKHANVYVVDKLNWLPKETKTPGL